MAETEDNRERSLSAKREWMRAWRAANLEKARKRNRAWRAANPEKALAQERAKRVANREKNNTQARARYAQDLESRNEQRRAKYAANPEKATKQRLDWRTANLEKAAYLNHTNNALRRNIPSLLTFEQWLAIWIESGKWEQRGIRKGQYVMARYGDAGPYAVGNVRICTVDENQSDQRKYLRAETRKRLSEATKARWAGARHGTSDFAK